jgi:hypothetical protein
MKKATGNKKGQEAFAVMQAWREYGVPELITQYELYSLTGGVVGKPASTTPIRLIDAAVKYVKVGGSKKDWFSLKEGK